jgi:hypothetical protein
MFTKWNTENIFLRLSTFLGNFVYDKAAYFIPDQTNIPVFVVSMTLFPAMACVVNSTDAKPVVVPS